MPNAGKRAFGLALADLRARRGYTQDEVAARIPTYYSNGGIYGRVERGERRPERSAALAILIKGLRIRDTTEIDRVLQLGDYAGMTEEEIGQMDLVPSRPGTELSTQFCAEPPELTETPVQQPSEEPPDPPIEPVGEIRSKAVGDSSIDWRSGALLTFSLAVAGLIGRLAPDHSGFVIVTSFLYAVLYVVSLFLESAFDEDRAPPIRVAVRVFSLMIVTSVSAFAIDRLLVDSESEWALPVCFGIFFLAVLLQLLLVWPSLAESAVVPATFQTHTAQSAYLKNTGYFLLIVTLFWLPSFNGVSVLAREMHEGRSGWVHQVMQSDIMMGRGLFATSVRSQLGLLLLELLLSLYMGHSLLARLQPHPRLNSYTLLFYVRAFVYFLLCLLCIGWYGSSLSKIT